MSLYLIWLKEVIGSLQRDCEHRDGEPVVPIDASVDEVAKVINKYVDEESLKNFFNQGLNPLQAAQEVCSL